MFKGLDQFLAATYNLDSASTYCYNGAFESYATLVAYTQFASSPSFLVNNLLFNFGYMYSDIKDLVGYFMGLS